MITDRPDHPDQRGALESSDATDTPTKVRRLIDEGAATLPVPGGGDTRRRWRELTRLSRQDVVVGRLLEAHADADAILAELTGDRVAPGQWWAVWAAEPPTPRLDAVRSPSGWDLVGAKAWCSGAGLCSHALVTARAQDEIHLFAVELDHRGVTTDLSTWHAAGMARSATGTVSFDGVPARLVGSRDDYIERAGFWHGAIGVAACWLGGAEAVADTLRGTARARRLDAHALAHLGAVDATLAGARWAVDGAADETDGAPRDAAAGRVRALRVRAVVESAATVVIDRVGRALGAAPLSLDASHATAVADLGVYVRQSHAERDLAALGSALGATGDETA